MVGNMIRVLRARMTLLVVDESGVSPVDYSTDTFYNPLILTGGLGAVSGNRWWMRSMCRCASYRSRRRVASVELRDAFG
jgi:hypothetical protein